jgi:nucleoside-diphosphate-sugar epimerase
MRSGKREKALVTGAFGLIGRATAEALRKSGYEVIGLDRVIRGTEGGYDIRIVKADLVDESCAAVLEAIKPDVIAHCAAVLPESHADKSAEAAGVLNRRIDGHIIAYCRRNRSCLVYASSTSIYSPCENVIREESPVGPEGCYARAKLESERKIEGEVDLFAILRINAPYGVGQKTHTVLKTFIENGLCGRALYYHGSGRREQDFVAAEDVAHAFVLASAKKGFNGIFNIATGRTISMRDLATLVVSLIPGTKSVIEASGQPDPQENRRASYDITRAREILRWAPSISLEEGVGRWISELRGDR